jgi:hypothetical protein
MGKPALQVDRTNWYGPREASVLLDQQVTELTLKQYCRDKKVEAKKFGPKKEWRILGSEILRLRREWGLDD